MSDAKKPYVIVVGVDYSETGELALTKALGPRIVRNIP